MSYKYIPRGRRALQMKQFVNADTGESFQKQSNQYQPPQEQYRQKQQQPNNYNSSQQQQVKKVQGEMEPEPEFPDASNPFKVRDDESGLVDENGKIKFKKIFSTRKKASVRTREQRIRQNRRLRKTIVPKNAVMALKELKGVSVGDFIINNNPNGGFIASVTINSREYEGRGPSKTVAKNNACEKAMRDYILAKMRKRPRKILLSASNGNLSTDSGRERMDTSESNTLDKTEDVPMVNLASFAIHKLFSEWENEGFIIPDMHPDLAGNVSDNESATGGAAKEQKKPRVRNELPQNWKAMHPASLLCFMRPGVTYIHKGFTGEPPNSVIHTLGIQVDGEDFEGAGRSKKIARRNAAAIVCNALFTTNFDLEAPQAPV